MNGEQRVAQQSQRPDKIRIAATGVVFTEAGIFAPVQSVFDSGPMVAHVLQPFGKGVGLVPPIADVIARFVEGLAVAGAVVMDPQRAARVREVHVERFDGDAADAPGLMASVALGMHVEKRGTAAVRRARLALMMG